ncbi:MAG: hypothetical protein HY013_10190 [Candidatus Solibacter usitatus]|nr:hypothetical protein [Candidatus Solibacter usitatus]
MLVWLLPLSDAAEPTESLGSPPTVTVFTHFDQDFDEVSLGEMKSEVASLLRPIEIEWRSLDDPSHIKGAFETIVVATFKGGCDADDPLPRGRAAGALGWTIQEDGEVLPFAHVDCDRVRKLIAPVVSRDHHRQRHSEFGRAAGLVLAHEMYHILANTTRHAEAGAAREYYSPRELVSGALSFTGRELDRMCQGRRRRAAPTAKPRRTRPPGEAAPQARAASPSTKARR